MNSQRSGQRERDPLYAGRSLRLRPSIGAIHEQIESGELA